MWKGETVLNKQQVLVVDGIRETEEVLKTVLEPRGLHVNRIKAANSTNLNQNSYVPSVVVLHEDSIESSRQEQTHWNQSSKVIIGRAEIPQKSNLGDSKSRYLQSPFQYKELIQAIENLLDE